MKFEFKKDLLLINLLALIEIFVATISTNDILRIVFGFPFLLFCPGYALVSALFPKKDDLDTVERIALSIGLSIAIVPLIGLILHFTPHGIRLYPILFSIASLIFLFSMTAWYRRGKIGEMFAFSIEIRWKELTKGERAYWLVLLLLIFLVGIVTVQIITTPKIEKFTEFYILGADGTVEYPKNLTLGKSVDLIIGIRNHEAQDVEYRVVILLENETVKTIEGIKLRHEERWEENVSFIPNKVGENSKLEFLLFKKGEKKPYRSLRLFASVG
jgi:uncharacterized membrane protein